MTGIGGMKRMRGELVVLATRVKCFAPDCTLCCIWCWKPNNLIFFKKGSNNILTCADMPKITLTCSISVLQ